MKSGYVAPGEKAIEGGARIRIEPGGMELGEGDGAFVEVGEKGEKEMVVTSCGGREAEWLLFEMEK